MKKCCHKKEAKLEQGQMFESTKSGKFKTAYLIDENPEDEFLLKISPNFPFTSGDPFGYIHRSKLFIFYNRVEQGKQLSLFSNPKDRTEKLKDKHIRACSLEPHRE